MRVCFNDKVRKTGRGLEEIPVKLRGFLTSVS